MFRSSCLHFLRCTSGLILAFTAMALAAQSTNVGGTVSDPSGAVIANATVELVERGAPFASAITDAKGQYNLTWTSGMGSRLRISASGFRTIEKVIDTASGSRELTVDVVLPIASL